MSYNVFRHHRNKSLSSNIRHPVNHKMRSLAKLTLCDQTEGILHEAKQLYFAKNTMPQAIRLFEAYLATKPDHNEANYMCAVAYLHLNLPEKAIHYFLKINDHFSNKAQALLLTAVAYSKIKNTQKSLELINQCLTKNEHFQEGLCYRGKLFMQLRQFAKAEADYRAAMSLPNASFMSEVGLGDCFRQRNLPLEAIEVYQSVLDKGVKKEDQADLELKMSVCLYQTEQYPLAESILSKLVTEGNRTSEIFYYLGQCQIKLDQRDKALLNLQYCLRMQTNSKVAKKAMKILVQDYLQNSQFYEAMNVIQLGTIAKISMGEWATLVQAFMLVIKGQHNQGLQSLIQIYSSLKTQSGRSHHGQHGDLPRQDRRKLPSRMSKLQSFREPTDWTQKERQFIIPLLLQFKAYAQFFMNSFVCCLDTYEEYESYMKDVFGRESNTLYNKFLCEALLMSQSEMFEEASEKLSQCVEVYCGKHSCIPVEPILYKIGNIVRRAILEDESEDLLTEAISVCKIYEATLMKNPLGYYYKGIAQFLLQDFAASRESLEKTLKLSDECQWRYLYLKGIIELECGHAFNAVKEFTAGLIVENRAELFLGRCIALLTLSQQQRQQQQQKQEVVLAKSVSIAQSMASKRENKQFTMENCLQDLQKFIEMETDQERISQWVSKVLFWNGAYEQVIRSIVKVRDQDQDMLRMIECVEIYDGEFENGGTLGQQIKRAFEGNYLSKEEELLVEQQEGQQSWLVVLHLYIREEYALLLKYLQRHVFLTANQEDCIHLSYNVGVTYLLLGEQRKAANVAKGLMRHRQYPQFVQRMERMSEMLWERDECLSDLKEELELRNKLLSSFLPFRPVTVSNMTIYVKMSIPFPTFPKPSLQLRLTRAFLLEEVGLRSVDKKIDAPWVMMNAKSGIVQFTEQLEESEGES